MNTQLYFLRSSEQFIVKELLHYAARLDETAEILDAHPSLEQYHRNYGNYNGDIGVYVTVDHKVAGGAWVRLLLNGSAYVDANTPELVLSVLPQYRNQGLATLVMEHLFREVAKIFPQISLSVRKDDPAMNLYERLGFQKIENSEHSGVGGSASCVMVRKLEKKAEEASQKSIEEERFRKSFSF